MTLPPSWEGFTRKPWRPVEPRPRAGFGSGGFRAYGSKGPKPKRQRETKALRPTPPLLGEKPSLLYVLEMRRQKQERVNRRLGKGWRDRLPIFRDGGLRSMLTPSAAFVGVFGGAVAPRGKRAVQVSAFEEESPRRMSDAARALCSLAARRGADDTWVKQAWLAWQALGSLPNDWMSTRGVYEAYLQLPRDAYAPRRISSLRGFLNYLQWFRERGVLECRFVSRGSGGATSEWRIVGVLSREDVWAVRGDHAHHRGQ